MGRLMDSILAAVGYKPSDRVVLTHKPGDPSEAATENAVAAAAAMAANSPASQVPDAKRADVDSIEAAAATEEKPNLALMDCTSCRVIGGGVLFGTAGYVAYYSHRAAQARTGFRRQALLIQGGLLAFTFSALGVARLGGWGMFNPNKHEYGAGDHINSELKSFFKFMNIKPPALLGLEEWEPPSSDSKDKDTEKTA